MKAAVFEKVKEPLKVDENYPDPNISGELGQAIIEIEACGVCHTDFGYLEHGVPKSSLSEHILAVSHL